MLTSDDASLRQDAGSAQSAGLPALYILVDRDLDIVDVGGTHAAELLPQTHLLGQGLAAAVPAIAVILSTLARHAIAHATAAHELALQPTADERALFVDWQAFAKPIVARSNAVLGVELMLFPPSVPAPSAADRPAASPQPAEEEAEAQAGAATAMQRSQQFITALSEARSPQEVLTIVAAHVEQMFGTARGVIGLVNAAATHLDLVQMIGYQPAELAPWQSMPLDVSQPGTDVVRSGNSQFWESPDMLRMGYPQISQALLKSGAWAIVPLRGEGHILGMLSLGFPTPRAFDSAARAYLETLARQCAAAIQRTQRYAIVAQARERAQRLQQVTAALGAVVTPEAVAAILLRAGMAMISADAAAAFAFDPSTELFHLLSAHDDTGELALQFTQPLAATSGPLADVRTTRELVLVESPAELAQRWPHLVTSPQRTGDLATVTVPLLFDTALVGALHLVFRRPHDFSAEEQGVLRALSQQGAQALERTRLYTAERAARLRGEQIIARMTRLYAVISALAEAVTLDDVASVIVRQGMAALGASAGSVWQLSADGTRLEALQVVGYPPARADQWQSIALDARVPMAEAARTARPILIESPAAVALEWPQFAAALDGLPDQATALLPLLVAGHAIGTMSLSFPKPRSFDADDRTFLDVLSQQCAMALERARLYAATEAQALRLGALAEASQLFAAASLDLQAVLDAVAQRVTTAVGDLGVVGLLSADRQELQIAAIAHTNPEALAVMTRLLEGFPPRADEGMSGYTLRTGQPQLHPVLHPDALRAQLKPAYWPYLDRFGIHSLMIAPLQVNGVVLGTLGALRDTPGRPYTPDDLTMLQELANRASLAVANARLYQQAQDAIQIRDQFLSIAAHELKTPLTALYGQAQLAQRRLRRGTQTPERLTHAIDMITRQAGRLDAMVVTLLDVGRIEQGQFVLDQQPLELGSVVDRVVEEVRPTLDHHTLRYAPSDVPLIVNGDALRLEQVLHNLLSNAVKYSPHGGTIRVEARCHEQTIHISVADEGIGIPSPALARLFQRFYRAENASAQHISGMGVGLYVVHEIVTRHGGRLAVASTQGVGSTFTLVLPVHADAPEES